MRISSHSDRIEQHCGSMSASRSASTARGTLEVDQEKQTSCSGDTATSSSYGALVLAVVAIDAIALVSAVMALELVTASLLSIMLLL